MRLLVVEDDDGIAAPLVSGLRREGFEVERVATGAAALAAGEPDLVLLDLHLPDLPGIDVLDELRRHPATSRTHVVVVSADSSSSQQQQLRSRGVLDYLTKPFHVEDLLGLVDTYVGDRR